jgi:DNA-binding CsgD family transcriptional regulator
LQVDGHEFALLRLPLRARGILLAPLTPAERLVLNRLLDGEKPTEIAGATGRAEHTIRNQLGSIYEKLGVHSLTEIIALLCSPKRRE